MESAKIIFKSSFKPLIGILVTIFVGANFMAFNDAMVYDIVAFFLVAILTSNFVSNLLSEYFRSITRN